MSKHAMKHLLSTLFMVILIVSLPIVFSQQLSVTSFSGQEGVDGYAARQDTLSVHVIAQIHGSPPPNIAAQRVRLYTDNTRYVNFDTCTQKAGNTYECSLTDSDALRNVLGVKAFEVRLIDADGRIVESVQRKIAVDSLDPAIRSFSIDPPITKGNQATISYAAEDYAYSPGDTSDCSGIKEITFIAGGNVIATEAGSIQECYAYPTLLLLLPIQTQLRRRAMDSLH